MLGFRATPLFGLALTFALSAVYPAAAAVVPALPKRASQTDYVNKAVDGFNQMQSYYDDKTGIWQNAWWNSANALTALADFQQYFPKAADPITTKVFPATLSQAPTALGYTGFLNDFYDDELWWALAWIQVYDVTNDVKYLDTASSIFEDAKAVWGTTPCGGLWWDKDHTYVNAIANELYLATAAKLANRKPHIPNSGYYWNEAVKAHDWFMRSGMINSENLVNDGLTPDCKNNGNSPFTYNQGVILGALTEMAWSSGDNSYNDLANTLALAGMAHFTDKDGILREPCEPDSCSSDQQQFKGVFARNIQFMAQRTNSMTEETRNKFIHFLQTNANALLTDKTNKFGIIWGAVRPATLQTQSSALDVLVGAAAVS